LKKFGVAAGIELKWPNDVLFSGRKLAGILLESLPEQAGHVPVVIGIGLNVQLPGDADNITQSDWIDMTEIMGQSIDRHYLIGLIINELLAQLPIYQQRGLAVFLEKWRQYDLLKGKKIIVHTALESLSGEMVGLDEMGRLLLRHETGEVLSFQCGEVSVRY
jgi:BirA family biotin operon repressor/biotin-[acetyl-CoA-carboxylase] ligase